MPTQAQPKDGFVMLRGSLYTLRRRYGKPNCHCASGDVHESPALAYRSAARTGTLSLTGADIEEVRAALARYDLARRELDCSLMQASLLCPPASLLAASSDCHEHAREGLERGARHRELARSPRHPSGCSVSSCPPGRL